MWAARPDLLTSVAMALLGKEAPLTGDELRFLRKRIGKSSKDFAQLIGKTSEQYSRIENGAVLTASNDKLVRLMVIAMSVIGALKEPELMERVANQTWDTGIGRSGGSSPVSTKRASGLWKRKLLSPSGFPHLRSEIWQARPLASGAHMKHAYPLRPILGFNWGYTHDGRVDFAGPNPSKRP